MTIEEFLNDNPQVTKEQLVEEVIRYREKVADMTRLFNLEVREHARTRSELMVLKLECEKR